MVDALRTGKETVNVANIRIVKLDAIVSGDRVESQNLLAACSKDGFFYLVYTSRNDDVHWKETLELIKQFYDEDMDTKMGYWRGRNKTGYKPLGIDPGVEEATKDGYESFRVSQSITWKCVSLTFPDTQRRVNGEVQGFASTSARPRCPVRTLRASRTSNGIRYFGVALGRA